MHLFCGYLDVCTAHCGLCEFNQSNYAELETQSPSPSLWPAGAAARCKLLRLATTHAYVLIIVIATRRYLQPRCAYQTERTTKYLHDMTA